MTNYNEELWKAFREIKRKYLKMNGEQLRRKEKHWTKREITKKEGIKGEGTKRKGEKRRKG